MGYRREGVLRRACVHRCEPAVCNDSGSSSASTLLEHGPSAESALIQLRRYRMPDTGLCCCPGNDHAFHPWCCGLDAFLLLSTTRASTASGKQCILRHVAVFSPLEAALPWGRSVARAYSYLSDRAQARRTPLCRPPHALLRRLAPACVLHPEPPRCRVRRNAPPPAQATLARLRAEGGSEASSDDFQAGLLRQLGAWLEAEASQLYQARSCGSARDGSPRIFPWFECRNHAWN